MSIESACMHHLNLRAQTPSPPHGQFSFNKATGAKYRCFYKQSSLRNLLYSTLVVGIDTHDTCLAIYM